LTTTVAYIPSPSSNGLELGPFFVHAYGLAYVVAITAAILITRRRAGLHPNTGNLGLLRSGPRPSVSKVVSRGPHHRGHEFKPQRFA
jgi:hypothetical protein